MGGYMKNIFALLNNFLTSGHSFSEDEYSLKSKFVLINSAFFMISTVVFILMVFLYIKGEYTFFIIMESISYLILF